MGDRILIIENDDALARLMRLQLSRGGYEVVVRGDGREGQEATRDFAPPPRTSVRRRRRHHGQSVEVVRANPAEPLGVQLELGSLWGHHAS